MKKQILKWNLEIKPYSIAVCLRVSVYWADSVTITKRIYLHQEFFISDIPPNLAYPVVNGQAIIELLENAMRKLYHGREFQQDVWIVKRLPKYDIRQSYPGGLRMLER